MRDFAGVMFIRILLVVDDDDGNDDDSNSGDGIDGKFPPHFTYALLYLFVYIHNID